jgi:hypothetical protein
MRCHVTSPHFSALSDLRQDGLDAIGWDGETDAIGRRVELWIDCRQRRNADHVALQVHYIYSLNYPLKVGHLRHSPDLLQPAWTRVECIQQI